MTTTLNLLQFSEEIHGEALSRCRISSSHVQQLHNLKRHATDIRLLCKQLDTRLAQTFHEKEEV